ncbi:MAG: single-stranded DNA-binding protein [Candidatus Sumerlaeota bacterium]|nr:single-stranded DNA-binding protein [Candidatus Sumerlaeota bacterium]
MDLNKVMLVGNLGRDPEVKYLPSGDAVCDFSIAVNRSYKDRQGETQKETAWVRITAFTKLAEFCSNFLKKGKAVYVEGRLRERSWETQQGEKRTVLEVVAERIQFAYPKSMEGGGEGAAPEAPRPAMASAQPAASGAPQGAGAPVEGAATEDDLPF